MYGQLDIPLKSPKLHSITPYRCIFEVNIMANSRLEFRIDSADKRLIERGALAAGYPSTSEFVLATMKERAEDAIQAALDTSLTTDRFNDFLSACNNAAAPNRKLTKAFQATKDMGFE